MEKNVSSSSVDPKDLLARLAAMPQAKLEAEYDAYQASGQQDPDMDEVYKGMLEDKVYSWYDQTGSAAPADLLKDAVAGVNEGRYSKAFVEEVVKPEWLTRERERKAQGVVKTAGDVAKAVVSDPVGLVKDMATTLYGGGVDLLAAGMQGTGLAGSDYEERLKGGAKVAGMLETGARQTIGALARAGQTIVPFDSEFEQRLVEWQRKVFGDAVPRAAAVASALDKGEDDKAWSTAFEDTRAYMESEGVEGSVAKAIGLNASELEKSGVKLSDQDLAEVKRGAEAGSELFEAATGAGLGYVVAKSGARAVLRAAVRSATGQLPGKIVARLEKIGEAVGGVTPKAETLAKKLETKTDEVQRLAADASKYNTAVKRARTAAGGAMVELGSLLRRTAAGSARGSLPGLAAAAASVTSGGDAQDALIAGLAGTLAGRIAANRLTRQAVGSGLQAAGRALQADLPLPLENFRKGVIDFSTQYRPVRAALGGAAAGAFGSAPFVLGAETPEEAAGALLSGASFGAGGAAFQRSLAFGADQLVKSRVGVPQEIQGPVAPSKPTGIAEADRVHADAEAELSQSGLRLVQQFRGWLGDKAGFYVAKDANSFTELYNQFSKVPAQGTLNAQGVTIPAEQSTTGKPVALSRIGADYGQSGGHEATHALLAAGEADPETRWIVEYVRNAAAKSLGATYDAGGRLVASPQLEVIRAHYEYIHPTGGAVTPEYALDEWIAEHGSLVQMGVPAGKLGGSRAVSNGLGRLFAAAADKVLGTSPGLSQQNNVTTSEALPYNPSYDFLARVEAALQAIARDSDASIPDASVESESGIPVEDVVGTNKAAKPEISKAVATVDVGVLNPVPVELTTDRSLGDTTPPPEQPLPRRVAPVVDDTEAAGPLPATRGPEVQAARTNLPAELTPEEKARVAKAQPIEGIRPVAERVLATAKAQAGSRMGAQVIEVAYRDKESKQVRSKRIAPYDFSFNKTNDDVTITAVDIDRVNHSAKLLFDWAAENGQPDRFGYTGVNDPKFVADLQTYLRNHAAGFKGGGGELRVGGGEPLARGEAPGTLPREKEQFFSMLMGVTPPVAPTRTTSVAAIARIRATAEAGGVTPIDTAAGSIEPNLLRDQLRREGAPVDRIGEDPDPTREQSNTKDRNAFAARFSLSGFERDVVPTGQRIDLPNTQAAEASFMPATRLYHGTNSEKLFEGQKRYRTKGGIYGDVVYLTDDPADASGFSESRGGKDMVVEVSFEARKPARLFTPFERAPELREIVEEYNRTAKVVAPTVEYASLDGVYGAIEQGIEDVAEARKEQNSFNRLLRSKGYDALWANAKEEGFSGTPADWVMPFTTEKVTRADNGARFMPAKAQRRQATLEDFSKDKVKDLPNTRGWAIFTAENPVADKNAGIDTPAERNAQLNEKLRNDLESEGVEFVPVKGSYGKPESSFIVLDDRMTIDRAAELARKYDQESIFTPYGLVYQDGTVEPMKGIQTFDTRPDDFFTEYNGTFFSGDIDFGNKIAPDSPEGQTLRAEEAMELSSPKFMPVVVTNEGLKKFTEEAHPLLKEADGTLKKFYHGSDKAGFMSFDLPQSGKTRGTGVFLTDDYRMASTYTKGNADVDTRRGAEILEQWKRDGDRALPDGVEIKPEWAILRGGALNIVDTLSKDEFSTLEDARARFADVGYEGRDLESIREVNRLIDQEGYEDVYADDASLAKALDRVRHKEPGIYELVVSAKDVVEVDWQGNHWDEGPKIWNILDENGDPVESLYTEDEKDAYIEKNPDAQIEESQEYFSTDDAARGARDMGADAVLIRNVFDSGGYGRGGESGDVLVVFDPKNIKALNSLGFDKTNPDIRFMPATLERERVKDRDVQFKGKAKEGSVGGVLDLVHFSSKNLTEIDPKKSFGKGAATPTDLMGEPKVFFYVKGTAYEAPIATRPNIYAAKVDGNSLYDYNRDVLNVRDIVNREKRDKAIRDAGFVGFYVETPGFDAVALFEKTKVKPVLATDVMNRRQLVDTGRVQATAADRRRFEAEDRRNAREEQKRERDAEKFRSQIKRSPAFKAEAKRLAASGVDEWTFEFGQRMDDWVDAEVQKRLDGGPRFMPPASKQDARAQGEFLRAKASEAGFTRIEDAPAEDIIRWATEWRETQNVGDALEASPQFMPAKKEPAQGPVLIPGDRDTVELRQKVNSKGKPVVDKKGRRVAATVEYRLTDAPALTDFQGPRPERRLVELPNREELAYDVTDPEWEKIVSYYESGALDAATLEGVQKTREYMQNPEIAAGKGWYSRMRVKLRQVLDEAAEVFSQLLGATSARTPVDTNFLQAMDALEQDRDGKFNRTRELYAEYKKAVQENRVAKFLEDAGWAESIRQQVDELRAAARKEKTPADKERLKKEADAYERFLTWEARTRAEAAQIRSKAEKRKDSPEKRKMLREAADLEASANAGLAGRSEADLDKIAVAALRLLPRQSNGKKFNANSFAVLKVLTGEWLGNRNAPKTPNFAGNLSGRTTEATIDVWAARFLRNLLYSKSGPWRIPPAAETGVSTHDFALGQILFKAIGKEVGLAPDDLQAVLWFAEKDRWEKAGWTSTIGAGKTSFDTMFALFFPDGGQPRTLSQVKEIVEAQRAARDAANKQAEKEAAAAEGLSVSAWKKKQKELEKARAKDEIAGEDTDENE